MNHRAYKTSIPAGAVEVIEAYHLNGMKKLAYYYVTGEKVGEREWYENGQLDFEYALRGGERHGNFYSFYENGQVLAIEPYHDGREHGTGKQWSEDGRLLVTWKLVHGTGLDLWCSTWTGMLSEEHYWPKEGERGYTRQWNSDEKTIWQEYFYVLERGYHGVWREWNAQGRPRRGFPQYYVNDLKVSKRQYLRACTSDPTLPPYRPEDDDPHRKLPAAYLAQRKKRRSN